MGTRKKKVSIPTLPSHIELISSKTGRVREYELSHAQRILDLQTKSGVGAQEIFNIQLYTIDERSRKICIKQRLEGDRELADQG